MTAASRPRGSWRPALLSGLVLPGLGQMAAGRPWRGLFFAATSLAVVAAVVARVVRETQRLMPVDPDALLDPALPVRLAVEIHRANASFFFWATLAIVALWVAAVLDCIPRSPVCPAPRELDQNRDLSGHGRPGRER